jgi:hypothetical protein
MPSHPPRLDVFLGGRTHQLDQKDDQMAQYDSTFTIPLGVKLFSRNVDFSKSVACNAESSKNLLDIILVYLP